MNKLWGKVCVFGLLSFIFLFSGLQVFATTPTGIIVKFKDSSVTPLEIKKEASRLQRLKDSGIVGSLQYEAEMLQRRLQGKINPIESNNKLSVIEKDNGVTKVDPLISTKSPSRTTIDQSRIDSINVITAKEEQDITKALHAYQNLDTVEWAVFDEPVKLFALPNDTYFSQQWDLNQNNDIDIDAPEAWTINQGNGSITIADIDTGLDPAHTDINHFINTAEVPNNNIDDDNNGYKDDVYGWNFINNNKDTSDFDGHGTHTAGTMGAKINNASGITGIANVKILPLRIFTSGQVDEHTSDVLRAIQYAADNAQRFNIKAINMSFGATRGRTDESASDVCVAYEPILRNLYSKGVSAVAAAGNGNGQQGPETGDLYYYQAPAGCYGVISVGATDQNGARVGFSNYGQNMTLAAPGASYPGLISTCLNNTYCYKIGTSMAAPHVTATTALMYYANPSLNPWQVKKLLSLPAPDYKDAIKGEDLTKPMGKGTLNAYKSVSKSLQPPQATEPGSMTATGMSMNFFAYNSFGMQTTTKVAVQKEGVNEPATNVKVVISVKAPTGQTFTSSGFTDDTNGIASINSSFTTNNGNSLQGAYIVTILSIAGDTNWYHPTLTSQAFSSRNTTPNPLPTSQPPTPTRTPTPTNILPSLTPSPSPILPSNSPTPTATVAVCSDSAPTVNDSLVSQGTSTTASITLNGSPSANAVDGNTTTTWNSGGTAPQWIELDLGQNRTVSALQLLVNQSPNGVANHTVTLKNASNQDISSRMLNCNTSWGQTLNVKYNSPINNVRYIRVTTTQSPSWIAWFEIKAFSPAVGPSSTPTPTQASSSCPVSFSCRPQNQCLPPNSPSGQACGTNSYCCYIR